MINCDGKHKGTVAGFHSMTLKGTEQVAGATVDFALEVAVRGKDYCPQCMAAILDKLDLAAVCRKAKVNEAGKT